MHVRCLVCNVFYEVPPLAGQDPGARHLCVYCRTWNRLRMLERRDQEYAAVGIDREPPEKSA